MPYDTAQLSRTMDEMRAENTMVLDNMQWVVEMFVFQHVKVRDAI